MKYEHDIFVINYDLGLKNNVISFVLLFPGSNQVKFSKEFIFYVNFDIDLYSQNKI